MADLLSYISKASHNMLLQLGLNALRQPFWIYFKDPKGLQNNKFNWQTQKIPLWMASLLRYRRTLDPNWGHYWCQQQTNNNLTTTPGQGLQKQKMPSNAMSRSTPQNCLSGLCKTAPNMAFNGGRQSVSLSCSNKYQEQYIHCSYFQNLKHSIELP